MAEHHTPAPIAQAEIDRAQTIWRNFVTLIKVSIAGSIVLLLGMAVFLL
jgi:hypothetical protein